MEYIAAYQSLNVVAIFVFYFLVFFATAFNWWSVTNLMYHRAYILHEGTRETPLHSSIVNLIVKPYFS